jgi:hypothetical protein
MIIVKADVIIMPFRFLQANRAQYKGDSHVTSVENNFSRVNISGINADTCHDENLCN